MMVKEGKVKPSWAKRYVPYKISISEHPFKPGKYSYAIAIGAGFLGSGHGPAGVLHGEYDLPANAMKAAEQELESL